MSSPRPIRWWLAMLAIATALPLIVILVWLFATQYRTERRDARDTALRFAQQAAERIRTLHGDSRALLGGLAARPLIRDADPARCDSLFAIVDFFPHYVNLLLYDAQGTLVCSATPQPSDRALSETAREWIEAEAAAGRLETGRPHIRLIGNQWVSALAAPAGRAPAAHSGTLVLVQVLEIAVGGTLPAGSVMTIIDRDGKILARSLDSHRWIGRTVRGTDVTEIVLRQREGRAEARGVDGVSRQYGFTHLPEIGWYIYVGVPTATVMEPVRTLFLQGIFGGAVIITLAVFAALALSRFVERPINELVRAARAVSTEGYSAPVPVDGPLEIAALGEAFNDMVDRRSRAEARLTESEQSLKALSDRLLRIQEDERTRIAREIHDDLGQSLTALKMDVGGLLRLTDSSTPAAVPVRDRIIRTLDTTVEAVQRIAAELRPSLLDDLGLVAALEAEGRLFEERTGIECDISVTPGGLQLDRTVESVVYRLVQEALTNVARHSNASRVEIRLRDRATELLLEVRDDGRGIRREEVEGRQSLGLIGMRERAAVAGGTVDFEGIEGRGTIVTVRIPVRSPE